MIQRLKFLIVPTLIAVAIFAGISSFEGGTGQTPTRSDAGEPLFDSFSEGINSVLFDESGAVSYTLRADRQVHFEDSGTELDNPFITLYRDGNSRWNLVADSGRISATRTMENPSQRRIDLMGEVEIYSLDEFGNRTVLSTDYVSIDPDLETLETDRPVRLVTTNIEQSSVGMFADLKRDEIVFLSQTTGRYEQITESQ